MNLKPDIIHYEVNICEGEMSEDSIKDLETFLTEREIKGLEIVIEGEYSGLSEILERYLTSLNKGSFAVTEITENHPEEVTSDRDFYIMRGVNGKGTLRTC